MPEEIKRKRAMLITDSPSDTELRISRLAADIVRVNYHELKRGDLRPGGEAHRGYRDALNQVDIVILNCPLDCPLGMRDEAVQVFRELVKLAGTFSRERKPAPVIVATQPVPVGLVHEVFFGEIFGNPEWGNLPCVFAAMEMPGKTVAIGSPLERIRREHNRTGDNPTYDRIQLSIGQGEQVVREFFTERHGPDDPGNPQAFRLKLYPTEVVEFARLVRDVWHVLKRFDGPKSEHDYQAKFRGMIRHYVESNHYKKMEPRDLEAVTELVDAGQPYAISASQNWEILFRFYECFAGLYQRQRNTLLEHEEISKITDKDYPAYISRDGDPDLAASFEITKEIMGELYLLYSSQRELQHSLGHMKGLPHKARTTMLSKMPDAFSIMHASKTQQPKPTSQEGEK